MAEDGGTGPMKFSVQLNVKIANFHSCPKILHNTSAGDSTYKKKKDS